MQEIVISLVAAVACRFMQDRHTDQYLQVETTNDFWLE